MTTNLNLIWSISDVFNGLMAIPNLIGLLFLSGVVVAETKRFELERKKNGSPLPLYEKTRRTARVGGFLSYLELANQ
nr:MULTISPECIES: alanine:cation symporter family protein [Exiguobacterium]